MFTWSKSSIYVLWIYDLINFHTFYHKFSKLLLKIVTSFFGIIKIHKGHLVKIVFYFVYK